MFSSGSTKFGDTIDDTHEVTGSMTMSGSVTVNDGNLLVTDKVGFGTNNPSNVLHFEFNDDSDVFTPARITDNSVSGILINNLDTGNGHGGMLKFANKNGDNHSAIAHSQDGNTDASLLFYSMDGGTLAEVMRVDHTHRVGIGDGAPGSPLDVKSSEAAKAEIRINGTNDSASDEIAHLILEASTDRRAGITIEGDSNDIQAFMGRPYDTANTLVFETDATERMRIASN